jgi:uncharacterized protein YjbJ (UPF0337 family)
VNIDLLEGKWHVVKGKVRERWARLTRDDVERADGHAEILFGKLQELYGLDREAAMKELEILLAEQSDDEESRPHHT